MIAVAYALVDEYGVNATFYVDRIEPDGYDPETGHTTQDTDAGATFKVTPPEEYGDHWIDGDLVLFGDMFCYLPSSGLSFTPELGMEVVIESERLHAVEVEPIYSGEYVCIYKLQLRK